LPEGATPKDGPSAGISITCALISTLTNTPVKPHVALTGEITLRGRVLAVGGLKEKILAAKRHGMKTVVLPKDNEEEILDDLKGVEHGLELTFVNHMDEVVKHVFAESPFQKNKKDATVKKVKKKKNEKKQD